VGGVGTATFGAVSVVTRQALPPGDDTG
jgi:hypothetical protein